MLIVGRTFTTFAKCCLTFYLVFARLFVFFIGYKPYAIFENVGKMWNSPFDLTFPDDYERGEIRYNEDWKQWGESYDDVNKFFPISLAEITLAWLCWFIFVNITNSFFQGVLIGIGLLILCSIFFYSLKMNPKFNVWLENRKQAKKNFKKEKVIEKIDESYKNWLSNNLLSGKLPEKVDVKSLPEAYNTSKLLQTVRVRFFATKAKVCKPYQK